MYQKLIAGAVMALGITGAMAATDYPAGYIKCAQIGSTCNMSGTHKVALGKSGSFVYTVLTGNFTCSNSLFPANSYSTSAWCSYNPAAAGSSSSSAVSSVASSSVASSSRPSSSSSSTATSSVSSSSSISSATSSVASSSSSSSSIPNGSIDARSLTGPSTPFQSEIYGVRNYSAPVKLSSGHDPANYKPAPKLPTWQFATVDPTGGRLTFEPEVAPANGWHSFSRKGKVVVTGGSAAATNRVYTVFNGQQLVAAINEARNDPKIIRIVGHIDLRWSSNNKIFKEYTSYTDQKFGGSIMVPSNTTLVGIADAQGRPARITGTTLLVGAELALTTGGVPQTDFTAWIAAGKDGEGYPTWTRNVIIRNLQMDTPWDVNPEGSSDAYADGMTLARAQNVWVDHLTLSDGNDTPDSVASDTRHDGLLDVVRGSDYVTISNNHFTKHRKTTLVGNGDADRAWGDEGRLHVTFSGNWWDNLGSRLPLNRFGQLHIFNNYITGTTTTTNPDLKFSSGIDARYHSNQIVQNNYYSFAGLKLSDACGKVIMGKDYTGFRSSGHLFVSDRADTGLGIPAGTVAAWDGQCGMTAPTGANVWTPPYSYTLLSASALPAAVTANAGAGKLK